MRKLVSVLTVLVLFVFVLPSCSSNDDFTEVIDNIDAEKSETVIGTEPDVEEVDESPEEN